MRGLSIFACDLDEARRLSDADPSVQAGRLTYDVFEWWVAAGTLAFPDATGRVGEQRSKDDDRGGGYPATSSIRARRTTALASRVSVVTAARSPVSSSRRFTIQLPPHASTLRSAR